MAYPNSSVVGANFATADAAPGNFAAMTVCNGSNDSLFVYCETVGTFATGMCGLITTSGTAVAVSTCAGALWADGMLGFIQTSSTSGQFAWFAQRGINLYVGISATCNPSVALYAGTTTPGYLTTTSLSSTVAGVMLQAATTTATVGPALANLSWPRWNTASM